MAARNVGKLQQSPLSIPFEQIEKTSSTLKRHPKMELTKPDLLQLLGVLEGELQAREIAIAVLKAEQVKQLLYPNKKCSASDPLSTLQRDSFGAFDATFDESTVKNLYNMQLSQLENFIEQQKNAQNKLKEQLQLAEERCEKLLQELEDEKRKHAQDTAQGDDVTYLLEKERERLRQENEFERQQNRCMEKDIKCLSETLEQERLRQKQIVLLLLAERKRLILRYVEEKQKNERLSQNELPLNEPMKRARNQTLQNMQKKKKLKTNTTVATDDLMKACTNALVEHQNDDVDKYEVTGINIAKKLKQMDPVQALYSESLINAVLRRGLLKTLAPHTDICNN